MRKILTQPQWQALHVIAKWDDPCPQRGTVLALLKRGLVEMRDDSDHPFQLTTKGVIFRANVILDDAIGKDVSDRIDYAAQK